MAQVSQLPCNGDGVCMICKQTPSEAENLTCKTCVTPWHASCLATPPPTLASTISWECPDCSALPGDGKVAPVVRSESDGGLVAAIRAIEADSSLTEQQKANKRQELLSGKVISEENEKEKNGKEKNDLLKTLNSSINCSFCMQLPERPVTVWFLFFFLPLLLFIFLIPFHVNVVMVGLRV